MTETHPPLYVGIIDLVRELWPNAMWTDALRTQWRNRLAKQPIDKVMQSIREHHANSRGKSPCLADVLKYLRINAPAEVSTCRIEEDEKRKVEKDRQETKTILRKMDSHQRSESRRKLEVIIKKKIPEDWEKWTQTQCSLILAIATSKSSSL